MNESCPTCRRPYAPEDVPPEPPVGSWVRDKHGAMSVRIIAHGDDGWAPAEFGFYPTGQWDAMWRARGPLIVVPVS